MKWLMKPVRAHRLVVWMIGGLMWGVLAALMLLVGRGMVPPSARAEVYWMAAAGAMATGWLVSYCWLSRRLFRQIEVIRVQRAALAELSGLIAQGIERGRSR